MHPGRSKHLQWERSVERTVSRKNGVTAKQQEGFTGVHSGRSKHLQCERTVFEMVL